MAWVKLDDDFFSNPKVIRAGRDARDLYLAALCFCNRGLTDGIVPAEALRRLAADAEIGDWVAAADRLVAVGLWEGCAEGYLVHDYLEYQPSRERVQQTREVRADAGRKGGQQKASNLLDAAKPFASENRKQNATPLRTRTRPEPVPGNGQSPGEPVAGATGARAKRKTAIPTDWQPDEALTAWAARLGIGADELAREVPRFRDHYLGNGETRLDWSASFRNWMTSPYRAAAPARASPNPNGYVPAAAARLVESERIRDDIEFFRREAERGKTHGPQGDERDRRDAVIDAEFTAADP